MGTVELSLELKEEIGKLETKVAVLPVIKTPEEYTEAAHFVQEIKARKARVIEFFRDAKTKAHAAWKAICAAEGKITDHLDQLEGKANRAMLTYRQEEERKRLEAQALLRKAEEERAQKERERLRIEAEKLAEAGKAKGAANMSMQADAVQAVPITVQQTAIPEVKGQSERKIWRAKVTNKDLLVMSAGSDKRLQSFLSIEIGILENAARIKNGDLTVPGIKFFQESILVNQRA